ncbi:MAG: sodium:solute symporter [Planctomycetota bacterium]|nr:sodium:solute symporter [Planctomycetota bacterium]
MEIHAVDTVILVIYMLAMVALGLLIGRKQKDLSGYLLGGRDLPWYSILGSIVATETSTATFLSIPGITFAATGDMRFLQLTIGYILGRVIVAVVLIPLYFKGQIYTAYEVLEQRFGGVVKSVASVLFLITRNLGDGLRLFLAGIALEKVLDISLPVAIIILGIATIAYTFFGGLRAVIWSDCIQLLIYMIGGLMALAILIQSIPGGWGELMAFAEQTERMRIFDLRFAGDENFNLWTEPYTLWAGILGGALLTLGTHGTDQMFVQRYLAARSRRDASKAVIFSGFIVMGQFILFLIIGIALACYYERVVPTTFEKNDEVFATFVVEQLPIGLVGLTLAAIFAAAMSTLSSSLHSSATSMVSDLYLPHHQRKGTVIHPDQQVRISKRFAILFGVIQIALGIGASWISDSVIRDALAIAGFTAGIMLGLFCLGVLTRKANQSGALIGIIAGIIVLSYIKFGTETAWTWLAVMGSLTTFTIGIFASWLLPANESTSERN